MLLNDRYFRCILFASFSFFCFAAALYFTNTVLDLIHFLPIPLLVSHFLIFKPLITKKKITSFCVFGILFILLITGYLLAFSHSVTYVSINLLELPLAACFLLSVFVILWSLDKLINLTVLCIEHLWCPQGMTKTKNILKNSLRLIILIFIAVPYLIAVFSTHWIKFSGTTDLRIFSGNGYQHVCFNSKDGTKLDGLYIQSTGYESESTVIIAPGRVPTKNLLLPYAKFFCDNGYNVFLFDLRGNGDSGGHKYSFGINETKDIEGAIDYITSNHSEAGKYIFGFGINEGATALVSAAESDKRLAGIVIDNTSGHEISLPKILSDCLPAWIEKIQLKITKTIIAMSVGHAAGNAAENIYEKIEQVSPCPILIANSTKSDELSRQQTLKLYAKAMQPKMLWQVSPNLHSENFYGLAELEYFQCILQLLELGKAKQQQYRADNQHLITAPAIQLIK